VAIGVALILASVVLGVLVVSTADETVAVYAADGTIVPGDRLDDESLTVVRVRLEEVSGRYMRADDPLGETAVAQRTVGDGELLPVSAVAEAGDVLTRPVTVPLPGAPPPGMQRGSRVDVWISAGTDDGYEPPAKALAAVEVASVFEAGGGLAALAEGGVSILLDDAGTAAVLQALANGDRVDVVVIPGSAPRG